MIELTSEQRAAVESPYKTTVVSSGAGAGKTFVISERARYLLKNGVKPEEIFLVTYTNNAAQEMQSRLEGNLKAKKIFIGTIHSLAAWILSINKMQTDYILQLAVETDNFDLLFEEIKKNLSQLYIPHIEHILIDEFQDICPNEYYFIRDILQPENIFIVGDARQSIYSFKGSDYKFFLELYNDPNSGTFDLTENFRNKYNIIYAAQQMIKNIPDINISEITPAREGKADISIIDFSLENVCNIILKDGDFKNWFVLARTNRLVSEIADAFDEYGVPYATFKQSEKTNQEIKRLMNKDVVKLLTIHSSKGLESEKVILFQNNLRGKSQETREEERRIRYVGITRARDVLIQVRPKKRKSPTKIHESFQWD